MSPISMHRGTVLPAKSFGPFTAEVVVAYAAASGDSNPLHTDPSIAQAAGLARPPVHGMLIMGCFEPYIASCQPTARVVRLGGKFLKPLLVGDAIEVAGKVVQVSSEGAIVLRLTARDGEGAIVCLAEASLRP